MGLLVKRRVTLDLARRGTQATVPFSLGDRCAYEVIFTLRDGSEQVALPPGTSAAVTVRNGAGGTGCVDGCVIDHVNNNVIYTPTVDALSVEGNIECTLHLFDGDGAVIGAPTFIFAVSEGDKADTEGEVSKALVASPNWGIIADASNKAKEAAAWAAEANNYAGQSAESNVAAQLASSEAREEVQRAYNEAERSKMWAMGGILADEPPSDQNNSYYWAMKAAGAGIAAEEQVGLAAAEVDKAKVEVQNAEAEVKKAKAEAQTAEAEAIKARMWAVGETVKSGKRNPTDTNNAMYYSDKSKEYMNEAEKYTNMTLSLSVDREKHIYTVSLIRDGTVIGNPIKIDLPFEEVVVGGEYDDTYEELVLKLKNGESVRIPVGDIISPDDVVRRKYPGSYDAVYTETSSGEVVLLPVKVYSGDGAANTLVKRGSLGEIRVRSNPEFDDEAAPKRRVDEVADALGKGLEDLKEWVTQNQPAPVEIVQNLGDSSTAVISQKGVTEAIDGLALKGSASGKIIRVDDVAPGEYPVKVRVGGKNLFHFARDFTGTANGITATALTGHSEIVASGTVTEAQAFAMDASATVLPAGTYTISIYGANDVAASYDRVYIENEDGIIANYIKTGAPKTFTLSKMSTVKICIIFGVGSTYDSATIGVQIELGDTATDYEPYVDPSSVKTWVAGKNLIPFPYSLLSGTTTKGGITATVQEDGGVCFNGTSTEPTYWWLSDVNLGTEIINPTTTSLGFIGNSEYSTYDVMSNGAYARWRTLYHPQGQAGQPRAYILLQKGTYENLIAYPQIEVGKESTEYARGDVNVALTFDENGEAKVNPPGSNMTVYSFHDGASFSVDYTKDINIALANTLYKGYKIPTLYFYGSTDKMTKDDKVTLDYKYNEKVGTCTMKWQGTSSIAYPKKNYTVTFDEAFEAVSGWGVQKKYCLKANYIDFSHIRNVCSAKLWGELVKTRSSINATLATTPNYGAIDGFPVCVVINDEYVGLYTFCVPKDAWMMGMGNGTQEAIVCAEGDPYIANKFKSTADTLNGAFDIEYVTDEDDTTWVETSLNRLIQACIDSDGTDLDTTVAQYLDWDSAIDYFIYCAALGHYDGMYKNYLLSTYDGVKWFFTAYDMDSVLGSKHTGKNVFSATAYDPVILSQNHKVFDLIYKYKMDEVRARFKALAEYSYLPLHEEQAIILFSDYAAQIPKALLDEDCKIWKTIPGTSYNNLGQIISWYHRRFKYLKEWFG